MASEMLDSERKLLATDKSLRGGGVDHRDPDAHLNAIRDRGSAALKEVRKTAGPDRSGSVKVLIDKVGGRNV
jgi:hypothetical protein